MLHEQAPIIFLDSGMGGLTYLDPIARQFSQELYIYVADTAHFPYGEKSATELSVLLERLAHYLEQTFHPKAVVVACNTATLLTYPLLCQVFSCPVVGVKPILNQETLQKYTMPLGILATDLSIRQLCQTSAKYLKNVSVYPANILVQFVENQWLASTKEQRQAVIQPFIQEFQEKHVQTVMLSCTHFLFLKEDFKAAAPRIHFIDNIDAVTQNLADVAQLRPQNTLSRRGKLYQTSLVRISQFEYFAQYFQLDYAGIFKC